MQNCWEFTQKNVFSELLSLLGRMTQANLTHQIEYLKVENEILRKRVGRSIRPTPVERRRLVKFGVPLGKDLKNIITVVTYETFLLWARGYKRNKDPERIKERGRPKTLEEIRKLVVRLAQENSWGYVRILGELNKVGIHRLSKTNVKNILKGNGIDPATKRSEDSWDNFIRRHFQTLWACDFFTKQVLTPLGPRMFFVLFFINIRTRKVYTAGARHLRYLISEYVAHYNTNRPHSSMGNRPLESKLVKNTGEIKCRTKLGGIIKNYYRG